MKFLKHPKTGVLGNLRLLKSIIIMKLIAILILFFNLNACADAYAQTTVTLNLRGVDFKRVLSSIEKQSIYRFMYSDKKIPDLKNLDVNVQNEEVSRLLDQLMANTGFKYNLL